MPKEVITIGAEMEYCSDRRRDLHSILGRYNLFSELDLQTEYYSNMIEFNEMLFSTSNSIQELEEVLTEIRDRIVEKAIEINEELRNRGGRRVKLYLSPYPMVMYEGAVFNGLHLHINLESVKLPLSFLKKAIAYYKYKMNEDFRFFASHHIWGAHRSSKYSFKQKARFSPTTTTRHGTLEIRVFSFDDLEKEEYRKKIAVLIHLITGVKDTKSFCKIIGCDRNEIEEFWNYYSSRPCELPTADWMKIFKSDERVEVFFDYDDDRDGDFEFLGYESYRWVVLDRLRLERLEIKEIVED